MHKNDKIMIIEKYDLKVFKAQSLYTFFIVPHFLSVNKLRNISSIRLIFGKTIMWWRFSVTWHNNKRKYVFLGNLMYSLQHLKSTTKYILSNVSDSMRGRFNLSVVDANYHAIWHLFLNSTKYITNQYSSDNIPLWLQNRSPPKFWHFTNYHCRLPIFFH